MGSDAGDTIYRHRNLWQGIRYAEMGSDGRQYDMQRRKQMAGDTKYRVGNSWQVIRYTEIGIDGMRYDIQRWVLMAGDTIFGDGI